MEVNHQSGGFQGQENSKSNIHQERKKEEKLMRGKRKEPKLNRRKRSPGAKQWNACGHLLSGRSTWYCKKTLLPIPMDLLDLTSIHLDMLINNGCLIRFQLAATKRFITCQHPIGETPASTIHLEARTGLLKVYRM